MDHEDFIGRTAVFAVAQHSFTPDSSKPHNVFCCLKPLFLEDGTPCDAVDFPSRGLVWWMLRGNTRTLAEPGRLLTGELEEGRDPDAAEPDRYQVRIDSVAPANAATVVEILDTPADWIHEPREFVSPQKTLVLDHPPLEETYLLWRGSLLGPLHTEVRKHDELTGMWTVALRPKAADGTIQRFPADVLSKVPAQRRLQLAAEVSLTSYPPHRNRPYQNHTCRYDLVLGVDFRAVTPTTVDRLVLETDQDIIRRAAKQILTRKKRQELMDLLKELESSLPAAPADAVQVVQALRQQTAGLDQASLELADAVVAAGVMAPQLEKALQAATARHINDNAAKLQAEIDEKIAGAQGVLKGLERRRDELQEKLEQLRRQQETRLEERRREFERDLARRREEEQQKLEAQRQELDRQRKVLSANLAEVSRQLVEDRDKLVNQFLAISPLLQQMNLFAGSNGSKPAAPPADDHTATAQAAPAGERFQPPAFIDRGSPGATISETKFFERFGACVEESGYKYRRIDLVAFHLAVKCNDLTILGGLPGTGKSSLPRLYAAALAGDEFAEGMQRFLNVGVSPSWLEMRDLLGYANVLDRRFLPAESGLYQHLVAAQEEEARRGPDCRIWLVCLDEMNLAHVEHYFSGFLSALECSEQREVRCFAPEVVSPTDPFAGWPTLRLGKALRFVGTVNFDETTRQISQRVLDRAPLLELLPSHALEAAEPRLVPARGPAVTLRNYKDWLAATPQLPRAAAEVMDRMADKLAELGCPLNPRRRQAIRQFIANAPPTLCTTEEALDLQIALRLLPQVRGLFRPRAREALQGLAEILQSQPQRFAESLRVLKEKQESDFVADTLQESAGP
jgi:hypothetical protein